MAARLTAIVALGMALSAACGCSGSARMNFVSLNANAIDPPAPVVHVFDADQCYYWIDDEGHLALAFQYDHKALINPLDNLKIEFSIVLDSAPAGMGRDYRATEGTLRGVLSSPTEEHRFTGNVGVISVVKRPGGKMRGSYRLWIRQFPGMSLFSLLPQRPGALLLFGTFDAIPDRVRGQKIYEHTEANGWERNPTSNAATLSPTSQPLGIPD